MHQRWQPDSLDLLQQVQWVDDDSIDTGMVVDAVDDGGSVITDSDTLIDQSTVDNSDP